jgi:hypothetical protein
MVSKRFAVIIAILAVLFLLGFLFIPGEPPPTADLALTFLGMTNNPVRSSRPVRLEIYQGATGSCAVFRVSNLTSNYFLDYHGTAIEVRTNGQWQALKSKSAEKFAGGTWGPGYNALFAMQWPSEASTNDTWRVSVNVYRQQRGLRRFVNDRLRREVFKLPSYAKHTIYSTEVDPTKTFELAPK